MNIHDIHSQYLGPEATPSQPLSETVPDEIRKLGKRTALYAAVEFSRGHRLGREEVEEELMELIEYQRIDRVVWLILGAFAATSLGAILVATGIVVIRLG